MTFSHPSANLLAQIALLGFPVLVSVLFVLLPPRRAAVWSCLIGTLFLPEGGYKFQGLPDYTKYSALSFVWLASVVFDGAKPFSLRPRWVDLPMAFWCTSRLGSSLSNGLGLYDGLSNTLDSLVNFGLPYWLGRTYFSDRDGIRELVKGILWGGLIYLPLCLWEIRFSPHLNNSVFGFMNLKFWMIKRYGGYQPMVFMDNPLQLSMWMASATVTCWWVAYSGAVRRLAGIPTTWLAPALLVTTLLCKTRGPFVLAVVGIALFYATRLSKRALPFALLLGIAASYPLLRGSGLLDAPRITAAAEMLFDARRVQSLGVRLRSEDMYIDHVKARPLLGWGGYGRGEVYVDGVRSIPDGLWVIALSRSGWLSVAALGASYLIGPLLMIRRRRAADWTRASDAPASALGTLLLLYWIDCLANAMITPVLVVAIGAATGWFAIRRPLEPVTASEPTPSEPAEAGARPRRAPSLARSLIERRHARSDGRGAP